MGGRQVDIAKLLIANRGEIACRIIHTAKKLGIPTVAVFSDADRHALHVKQADEAFHIGPAAAADSYLKQSKVTQVAQACGATAVHPGYGFLSENASFAALCEESGIRFVGPPSTAIHAMGDKTRAKSLMSSAGVPVVPGYHGEEQHTKRLAAESERIGFPLLVKAALGGGGKGMKLATHKGELMDAIVSAKREAAASFGDDRVLLERFIVRPRHVEVQVFADSHGDVVHLFERDCSVQRRHQKVIEEAPAPGLDEGLRQKFGEAAVAAAAAVGYVNAGTVEFILDTDTNEFFFMEMNTRLQVEHPVTEAITGVDLVEWQLRVAAGEKLPLQQHQIKQKGHAFEGRLYAESPHREFLPGTGSLARWRVPRGADAFTFSSPPGGYNVRVDSGVQEGDQIGVFYDPMIAKVVSTGPDRDSALRNLHAALSALQVSGLPTNQEFMRRIAVQHEFMEGSVDTSFISKHQEELLHTQAPTLQTVALAWLSYHHMSVRGIKSTYEAVPGMGAWYSGDNLRINHSLAQSDTLSHPLSNNSYHVTATYHKAGVMTLLVKQLEGGEDGTVRDESTFTVLQHELKDDSLSVCIDDRVVSVDVASYLQHNSDHVLDMWMAGEWIKFHKAAVGGRRAGAAEKLAGSSQVTSPMPGRVIQVCVEEGATVKEGDRVAVVEAMKMEHAVKAPKDGVISDLGACVGMQVQEGDVLALVLDPTQQEAEQA